MANGNFFSFVAGLAAGAVLYALAKTEKGSEVLENGRAAVLNGLDKLEDTLKDKVEEEAPAAETPAEEASGTEEKEEA